MPPPNLAALAYSVPSFYTNLVAFTYINGVFRVTFFEQHLTQTGASPELVETLVPRTSVTLTPGTFTQMLQAGNEIYNAMREAATTTETFASSGGGTLQ